jgi:hypothetical protein
MSDLSWRKSSYSDPGGGECVEVAVAVPVVCVRDSKHTDGPVLSLPCDSWCRFLGSLWASDAHTDVM